MTQLLKAMDARKMQLDVVSFGAAISSCERASVWQQSLVFLGELQGRRLEQNIVTCSAAISACEKAPQMCKGAGRLGFFFLRFFRFSL